MARAAHACGSLRHLQALGSNVARIPRPMHSKGVASRPPSPRIGPRALHAGRLSATPTGEAAPAQPDWSAAQYLKFGDERTRPVHDLIARIPPLSPASANTPLRIVDLGCGPGNSTAALVARFPGAAVIGVDSSPDMLARARPSLPAARFVQADVRSWGVPIQSSSAKAQEENKEGEWEELPADLLFSNAVFHWLRRRDRIQTIVRLLRDDAVLRPGGVLAFQMPDNRGEPSHVAMRDVAARPGSPWASMFRAAVDGDERPDCDAVETPREYYDALAPLCEHFDIWHTLYQHVLDGPRQIVEWVRGSGLQPFVNALPVEGGLRQAYLEAYERSISEMYPPLADERVMLMYPRLFAVAVKRQL